MNAGKKAKPDAAPSRLLLALHGRVTRYMARAGLIAFMAEPADGGAGGGAAGAGDGKPAGGDAGAGAAGGDGKPADGAGDGKPADGKPADGKPADGKPADGKPAQADKPTGAPEAYEAFKLPEGVQPDAALTTEFGALAKELGLSQENAQKLVDFNAKQMQAGAQALEAQSQKWATDAQADKEFGGEKFAENLATSQKALEKFATPEFRAFLNTTKLGNHPEMLRTFFRIGQAVSQDGFVGGQGGAGNVDPASVMFPTMKK